MHLEDVWKIVVIQVMMILLLVRILNRKKKKEKENFNKIAPDHPAPIGKALYTSDRKERSFI